MWAILQDQASSSFVFLQDGSTLGSARSNRIVLPQKSARALQGQFKLTSESWIYRDFVTNSVQEIRSGTRLSFGEFSVSLVNEETHARDFLLSVASVWREILNKEPQLSFEVALKRLSDESFQGAPPAQPVVEFLLNQFREYSLSSPIERLLSDESVTDVLIQSFDSIWIEKSGCLLPTSLAFSTQETFRIYIENLLADQSVSWDESVPYVDFKMKGGERAHLIGPPITQSFCLSIRKPHQSALGLQDLRQRQMFQDEAFKILQEMIEDRKNILVAGATGSGKTTLLKALLMELPERSRALVLEDTPELELPLKNLVFLRTRIQARSELPSVDLKQLVKQSLRMRPDRIIVGEVRGPEAMDLLHAMNTGHRGSMASLHANSCRDALYRLEGLVQMSDSRLSESVVRDLIARNVQGILFCGRNKSGERKLTEIAHVRGRDREQILLEMLYEDKS